jgi:hypothetical protein
MNGHLLLHQKAIGLAKHEMGGGELVGKGMNGVFHQAGNTRGLDPVPGHVPDEKSHLSLLGSKDIVEVTAHLCLVGGGPIEMAELHPGEFLRDVEQRLLQATEKGALLLKQARRFCLGHPKLMVLRL